MAETKGGELGAFSALRYLLEMEDIQKKIHRLKQRDFGISAEITSSKDLRSFRKTRDRSFGISPCTSASPVYSMEARPIQSGD